jgi:imidazolonepropionase
LGGARALRRGDLGHLGVGARADAVLLDAPSPAHLVYRPGMALVAMTIRCGRRAWTAPGFAPAGVGPSNGLDRS